MDFEQYIQNKGVSLIIRHNKRYYSNVLTYEVSLGMQEH